MNCSGGSSLKENTPAGERSEFSGTNKPANGATIEAIKAESVHSRLHY
jgi:hypothetical protein